MRMIFHHPCRGDIDINSGSRVRPVNMLNAFRMIGYEVDEVFGNGNKRRIAIRDIDSALRSGVQYDFLYAESSTTPMLLNESHHVPIYPFMDFHFFRKIKRAGVPSGLFYRDFHWRFDVYTKSVSRLHQAIMTPLYKNEWWNYRRLFDYLFLPALAMKQAMPTKWSSDMIAALPPGCALKYQEKMPNKNRSINLFYVGGVTPPLYDLEPMFEAMRKVNDVTLTICCREPEWQNVSQTYNVGRLPNVKIVHASGEKLAPLYLQADICACVWRPYSYLGLTLPIKIPEALGYGIPIVVSTDTEAARFVEREGIGWTVANSREFVDLLQRLKENPDELDRVRKQMKNVQEKHTWLQRARTVAQTLTSLQSGAATR